MKNERSGLKVMSRLVKMVKPLSGFMVLAVLLGTLGHLAATFIPVLGASAVLEAAGRTLSLPFTLPFSVFICLVILAVLRGVLRYGEQWFNHFIAFRILALVRDRVFRALRRLVPAKLEGRGKGNLISLITSDIELLEVFYAHTVSPVAIALIYTVIMFVFIGYYNWILALIALAAYISVGVIIPVYTSRHSGGTGRKLRDDTGNLSTFLLDSLYGVQEIMQYGKGEERLEEMCEKTDSLSGVMGEITKRTGKNMASTGTLILFFDLLMLTVSSFMYRRGLIGFEAVFIPTVSLMSSFGPVISLANLGSTLQNTFAAGNRILDLLDEEPVVSDIEGKENLTDFSGIKAEDIGFSYGEEGILRDLTLEIPKGLTIGITGRSGSGKSTFLKLLMRFFEPDKGRIVFSGRDLDDVNTVDLKRTESYVTQETFLFRDSISENLRIAKPGATEEELIEACRKASVHDFIMSLPKGYDSVVGELGDTLSSGEKQRIGLARAFLHDSPLMLLDEPTSNLDSLNEASILRSLKEETVGKTVVLVSHRESTMHIADRTYSVENGRLS